MNIYERIQHQRQINAGLDSLNHRLRQINGQLFGASPEKETTEGLKRPELSGAAHNLSDLQNVASAYLNQCEERLLLLEKFVQNNDAPEASAGTSIRGTAYIGASY